MANETIEIDGEALKAAVSTLSSRRPSTKKGELTPRKKASKAATTKASTSKKKTPAKKSTTAKSSSKAKQKATSASATTKKKSTTDRKSLSKPASKTTAKSTSTSRARGLEADLKKNQDETYTRMELMDGIRLAVQEAGMEAVQKTLVAMVSDWTPILGEKLEKEAVNLIIKETKSQYSKSNEAQKKALRALVFWIRNDFDLGKSLDASEFTTGFTGDGNASTSATPLNLKPLNEKYTPHGIK